MSQSVTKIPKFRKDKCMGEIYITLCTRVCSYLGVPRGVCSRAGVVRKRPLAGRGARTVGRGAFALGGGAGTLVAGGVTSLVTLTRRVNRFCRTASVVPASGEAVEQAGGHTPPGVRRAWRVGDDGPLDGASTPGGVVPRTPDLGQGWHGVC